MNETNPQIYRATAFIFDAIAKQNKKATSTTVI